MTRKLMFFILIFFTGMLEGKSHLLDTLYSPVELWTFTPNQYIPPENLPKETLVVLPPDDYILTFELMERQQQVYGYFNLSKYLIKTNPDHTEFLKRVLEEEIPKILFKRILGLFIFNTDTQLTEEQELQLIQSVRYHYPYLKIMLLSTNQVLDKVAKLIDVIVFNGIYSGSQHPGKFLSSEKIEENIESVKKLKQENNELLICSIEYAHPEDETFIQDVREKSKKNGAIPHFLSDEISVPFLSTKIVNED